MKIESGEVMCDKCNGTGIIVNNLYNQIFNLCPKCFGHKKLTWVENIFGKDNESYVFWRYQPKEISKKIIGVY